MERLKGIICTFLIFLCNMPEQGKALDCFKCVSTGGDNKACDDPFHNNGSLEFLESPCMGGRKGRDGLFPATACMKIAGIYDFLRRKNARGIDGQDYGHHDRTFVFDYIKTIKLISRKQFNTDETGLTLTIRGCALDSGTLTTDSELIRMSHCGGFYFEEKYVRGCVQSCNDADACNSSTPIRPGIATILPILIGWTATIFCLMYLM